MRPSNANAERLMSMFHGSHNIFDKIWHKDLFEFKTKNSHQARQ